MPRYSGISLIDLSDIEIVRMPQARMPAFEMIGIAIRDIQRITIRASEKMVAVGAQPLVLPRGM